MGKARALGDGTVGCILFQPVWKEILWRYSSMASGLSDADMQAIAKEMNLSETTFILPRDRGDGTRTRHPGANFHRAGRAAVRRPSHVGDGFCAARRFGAKEIALELNVGRVPVRFEETAGQPVFGEMTQIDPVFGVQHDREAVARGNGLESR